MKRPWLPIPWAKDLRAFVGSGGRVRCLYAKEKGSNSRLRPSATTALPVSDFCEISGKCRKMDDSKAVSEALNPEEQVADDPNRPLQGQAPAVPKPEELQLIIEELNQSVSTCKPNEPLEEQIRAAVNGIVDKHQEMSCIASKVKFLHINRQYCILHSPTLKQVFVLLPNQEALVEKLKSGRVKAPLNFNDGLIQIAKIYAECKEKLDDGTEAVAISDGRGKLIAKALKRMFEEVKIEVRESEDEEIKDPDVYRPPPVGGVDMDEVYCSGNLHNISSMTIDTKSGFALFRTDAGELSLGESFLPQEIAEVLYYAYEFPRRCSFSLDPSDPLDPSGPFQKKLYYPPEMEGTMLGSIMWMADWKMKQLSQGEWYIDDQGVRTPINDIFPDIKSSYDFDPPSESEKKEARYARLWFVIDHVHLETVRTDNALTLKCSEVKIRTKAMRMTPDPSADKGLKDIETAEDDPSRLFANYLTENFDRIYPKVPSFEKMRNLAILRAFADYIRDVMKVPKSLIKPDELKNLMRPVPDDFPHHKVPRISTQRSYQLSETYSFTSIHSGGVNLEDTRAEVSENSDLSTLASEDERCIRATLSAEDFISKEINEYMKDENYSMQPMTKTSLPLFQIFVPTPCSVAGCSSNVSYDLRYFDEERDPNCSVRVSNYYSYKGQVYCLDHHPMRCHAPECPRSPPLIPSGESYVKWNNTTFHKDCLEKADKTELRKLFPPSASPSNSVEA